MLRRTIQTLTLAAVFATAAVVGAWPTFAATVTSANDYPSTLQTSQASNHRVLFTTPTGAALGSTITLTFATSFDTSTITHNDVDVADDGVDLTTASSCGSVQASVAIASDVVTITICAGGGGAIAAASAVAIEIGTNATSSGTGTNQITNPSSTGNYYVSIAGTFGDSGSIILPIGSDDSFGVTATVPSGGGTSCEGCGGGEVDATGPTISDIVVSSITTSSAVVSWTTSEAATRVLDYGLTTGFELGTISESGYYTSHSVNLTRLTEGTTYYFQIRAADIEGNSTTSSTESFTTLDETAPVISNVQVVDITTTSARVTWDTNEDADSTVSYGLTSSYTDSESDSSLVTSHSILLTDLTPGTTYHFQVLSADASSNQASSDDETFTTDEDDPPGNVTNLAIQEGDTVLTLTWENPDDEDLAGILVLMCEDEYPSGSDDPDCVVVSDDLTESLTVTGLTNGTTYYFGVFAYDEAGQFASGALESGTPSAPDTEVPPVTCGDGACSEGEDADSCPADCPVTTPGGELCGDGICSSTETADSCPADCPVSTTPSCGDAICSADESSLTCPADCKEEPEEPTSTGAEESDADLLYTVADDSIELTATDSGVVEVISTSDVALIVPADTVQGNVQTITVTVGEDTYLMRLDVATDLYTAEITVTDVLTILDVLVLVTYEDGSTDDVSSYLRIVAPGLVYQVIDGEEAPVNTATVTLFEYVDGDWTVWDGSPYNQYNPTDVEDDGTFYWYVSNGTYRVSASSDGFESATSSTLTVENAIVNPSILLIAIEEEEEEIVPETTEGTSEEESSGAAPSTLAESFLETLPIVEAQQILEAIRDLPGVEEATQSFLPELILAFLAAVSLILLAVAFDLLPFLQYLFTAPILFFWRQRRKGYGVVYNAIAKTTIDLATVRLFQLDPNAPEAHVRLIKSRVTDKGGRYFFLVQPGKYRMTVTKAGFQFPSEYLKDEKVDGPYLDIYHGEVIEVTEKNAVITANIPMDPSQASAYHAPASVLRRKFLRWLQHSFAIIGVVAAIIFAILRPTTFSIGMVVVQIVVYLLVRRLAKPRKPMNWGIVYDKVTGRPLSRVVARIFETKYNKLLETQVTDNRGHYAFLLGPNQYYATFKKEGFKQKHIYHIDYSAAQEPQGFSEEVPLESEDHAATE